MAQFYEELKRRSVFRVAAAYIALVWLTLQVIDVLKDILAFPDWVARLIFFSMVIGFPIALVLAWAYEITPEGVKPATEVDTPHEVVGFGGRRIDFVIIGALSLVIILLIVEDRVREPEAAGDPDAVPMVSAYRQLTTSPVLFPPTPSEFPIVTDGTRLFFSDWNAGLLGLRQMSTAGGEAIPIEPALGSGTAYWPNTMTPDGSHLVLTAFSVEEMQTSIWHLPVAGGTRRRLGEGAIPRYSPDGEQIVYAAGEYGQELWLARSDLTEPRKLAEVPGRIHWPGFSPDGREIRFHFYPPRHPGIWRVSVDGTGLRRLLPGWERTHHCCGVWTPDGEYFVFEANRDNRSQLWAIRESGNTQGEESPEPVQITTGALEFIRPTIADHGKTIYAIGWQLQGEVVRRHSASGVYVPLPGLEMLSAEGLSYSRDEKWVAYISYPEGELWRSRIDGEERLRLTRVPMAVADVRWSPNGDMISFNGKLPGQPQRCYIVSADGGVPSPIAENQDERWQWSAAWSPDSTSIAFSEGGKKQIQIIDLVSGEVAGIEGSEGLRSPDWSPDGRYLITNTRPWSLQLFDLETKLAEELPVDMQLSSFFWDKHSRYIYYVESEELGPEQAIRRIDIHDKTVELVATVGTQRATFGDSGFWFGLTPAGEPMFLRDLSIHHIYALNWLPE